MAGVELATWVVSGVAGQVIDVPVHDQHEQLAEARIACGQGLQLGAGLAHDSGRWRVVIGRAAQLGSELAEGLRAAHPGLRLCAKSATASA